MIGKKMDASYAEMAILVRSFQITKMLQIAAALELADRIDKPCQVAALASESRVEPEMLLRLCRALAAFQIFAVTTDGTLSQTERSAWLRKDSKPSLHYAVRYWAMPSVWTAWGNLDRANPNR